MNKYDEELKKTYNFLNNINSYDEIFDNKTLSQLLGLAVTAMIKATQDIKSNTNQESNAIITLESMLMLIAESATESNKPKQLVIPKSIALILDSRWNYQQSNLKRNISNERDALYNAVNPYANNLAGTDEGEWIDNNQNLCLLYLTTKSMNINIVKIIVN